MEHHDRQQVAEVYTIRQVTELIGVPENTIRSWERRYGLPEPDRTAGKQRRYTVSDVEFIRSIQAARDRGRTMDQAIAEATAQSSASSRPALHVIQPPRADQTMPRETGDHPLRPIARRLASSLAGLDFDQANRTLADTLLATPVEVVASEVLSEAHESLMAMRLRGELEEGVWLLAAQWIERKLLVAYEASSPESGDLHLVVVSLDDNTPMLLPPAIALSRGGFRTTIAGIGPRPPMVRDLIDQLQPDGVVVHAASQDGLVALRGLGTLVERMRTDDRWDGVLALAVRTDLTPEIPRSVAIGDDTGSIAATLRQALSEAAVRNEDSP